MSGLSHREAAARGSRRWSALVLFAYTGLAVVMTWPLAAGLTRDVPGDLGDSLLNLWILGWGAEQVPALASGRLAFAQFWDANIFHPEPLALALSEHLFAQVLQILPVYALTGNLILAYNLLFISTFALSGFGMYLLVRDLLGADASGRLPAFSAAAFVAGLVFAFIPLRLAQVAHIQSLSTQWMPLALYGLRRFIITGRGTPLAGGAAALVLQNWSCGYYLMFFTPLVPVFVVHQLWTAGRLGDARRWAGLAGAAVAVTAATVPFLLPYLEAQRVHGFHRAIEEVISYSADVHSYFSAPETLRLWGAMQSYPKAEGELFFGVMPWLLAAVGLFVAARRAYSVVAPPPTHRTWRARLRHAAVVLLAAAVVAHVIALAVLLVDGPLVLRAGPLTIRATSGLRLLANLAITGGLLLALSPTARLRGAHALRSPIVLAALLALLALWLSLGPVVETRGRALPGLGLYAVLYDHVPGFEGLRVPARYSMVAAMFLSVVAGAGAAAVLARTRRRAAALALTSALVLADAWFVPMPLNLTWGDGAVVPPPRIEPADDAPAVYHVLAKMPPGSVVAEFPFGDAAWDLRYVYYSTVHWHPLVNGYSGVFPPSYARRAALLQRVGAYPEEAWRALREAGTTHVVVHTAAMPRAEADGISRWLTDHFAVEIARFGSDVLFDISGAWPMRPAGPPVR